MGPMKSICSFSIPIKDFRIRPVLKTEALMNHKSQFKTLMFTLSPISMIKHGKWKIFPITEGNDHILEIQTFSTSNHDYDDYGRKG